MSAIEQPAADSGLAIVRDATCTHCCCVCDDIDLTVKDHRIIEAERACELGWPWFVGRDVDERPACLVDGQPATVADGVERAARILAAAHYPLIYGLADTTCEAQRVAVSIGDWIGGNVDTTTSDCHGPTGVAFQGVGEVTSSLGEMANRGDLIIFWGANPAKSQPRHLSKYSLWPQGMFLPHGRADRTCVVIDVTETETSREADIFLRIKPGNDFEALWALRALARGVQLDAEEIERETGVPLATWQDLMARMKQARFGVMLFGTGLAASRGEYLNTEALLALVRDMNAYTRFISKSMRERGNVIGADNVITWRTGYPFGVNLSRGYPRFNPGEFTARAMLERREIDAAMIVGSDAVANLGDLARKHLATVPCVTLDASRFPARLDAAVAFTTATYGIHVAGTVYRMDEVPIPLRPALTSQHPSDIEVLRAIERRVLELKAAARVG